MIDTGRWVLNEDMTVVSTTVKLLSTYEQLHTMLQDFGWQWMSEDVNTKHSQFMINIYGKAGRTLTLVSGVHIEIKQVRLVGRLELPALPSKVFDFLTEYTPADFNDRSAPW
jgi:hypothetical protein